jgi:hypothetical protein
MAADPKKATAITNLDATPLLRAQPWYHGGAVKSFVGTVEAADAADATTSIYRFFRVGSWMRVEDLFLMNDALSAGAVDVGLYRTTNDGGAVVDVDFFASAVSVASANKATGGTNIAWEAAGSASDISKVDQRIWEVLGLTTDPNLEYDVAATVSTALGAAGTISLRGKFAW